MSRADDARRRQRGEEQHQRGHSDRARAHGRESHRGAEESAGRHGRGGAIPTARSGIAAPRRPGQQPRAERDGYRRQDQHQAQGGGNQRVHLFSRGGQHCERAERKEARGHAARGEQARDPPVDMSGKPMGDHAARLGDAGVEQVGAHGGDGGNAEAHHEHRSHEGPAAYARHSDDGADGKARSGVRQARSRGFSPCEQWYSGPKSLENTCLCYLHNFRI